MGAEPMIQPMAAMLGHAINEPAIGHMCHLEWAYIAALLDRFLLILFIIVLLLVITVVLGMGYAYQAHVFANSSV